MIDHTKKFREAGLTKDWIQNPDNIYVEYNPIRHDYEVTVFWIEEWKPGNYGFRIRGDERFPETETPDYSAFLDQLRVDMLEYYDEMGMYPRNEEKARAYAEKMRNRMYSVLFQDGGSFWHCRYEGDDGTKALEAFTQATYDNPNYVVTLRFARPKNEHDLALEAEINKWIEDLDV